MRHWYILRATLLGALLARFSGTAIAQTDYGPASGRSTVPVYSDPKVSGRQGESLGRGFRHRAGHQARPHDGDALGPLQCAGNGRLWGEPGRGLPRLSGRRQRNVSEETSRKVDAEIRRLVETGYADAEKILIDRRADLETLAHGLREFATLTGDEIKDLLGGGRPIRADARSTGGVDPALPDKSRSPW